MASCENEDEDSVDSFTDTDFTLRSSVDNQHWVEELFPPAFGFTVDELLADVGQNKDEEQKLSMFDKYARRVHPLDTSAVKNVYERVWLMTEIQRQEKEKITQEKEKVGDLKDLKKGLSGIQVRDADTSTTEFDLEPKYDIHDPCIWSDSEIQVLREVFQTARHQNQDLQVQLQEITDRYDKLKVKHDEQSKIFEVKTKELNEATKANSRLHILGQSLNQQLKKATASMEMWKSEVDSLTEDRQKYMGALHENKVRYNKERLEKKKITSDLEKQTKEAIQDQILSEEKLKVSYNQNMSALQKKIERLQEELSGERKSHARTKRGLEHLRTHFSSLPYTGETEGESGAISGMVTEDQLKTWTY